MKHNFKLPCMILATALATALHAAVPLAWEARPNAPAPASFDRHHGETIDFRCTLTGFDAAFAPAADVRLWYQTNGMGQAWWSAPATVQSNVITATWSPALDPGADRVFLFFGAPSNVYASAVLRLRHSPGFTPSVLTLPVQRLDFAAVEIANAPYYTKAETESKIAELAPVPGDYETVSNRAMRISLPGDEGHHPSVYTPIFRGRADSASESYSLTKTGQAAAYGELKLKQRYQEDGEGLITRGWWPTFLDAWNAWHWVASEDYVDDAINNIDIPSPPDLTSYATKRALQSVSNIAEEVRTESALVYRLYSGSNVVAEVTNYNSQVHAPALRPMHLNEPNEHAPVRTATHRPARTLPAASNYTDRPIPDYAAPRAWSRTTSGLGSDAPANTTWISTPRTVIAGGLEYAKIVDTYGEVWVLTSNGMTADFTPDTNAYFRITADDGTPVFSIEKSDAQVVGAYAEGITVAANSVTMPVPVVSAEAPTMYWRQQLDSGDWSDQATPPTGATVTWTGSAGSWVCTVTFSGTRPPSMFFKFSFIQEGGVVIRNNATTDLSSGIWVNGTKFVPTVSGNNLIWTKQ